MKLTTMTTGDPGELTIRAMRWPSNKPGMHYWIAEHRRDRGYFPLRKFGTDWRDGCECTKEARRIAEERGLPFVSETGLNTEEVS